jgi:hypothetical protein
MRPSPRRRFAVRPHLDGLEERTLLDADATTALRALAATQAGATSVSTSSASSSTPLLDLLNSSDAVQFASQPSSSVTDTLPSGVANVPRGFLVAYDGDAQGTSGAGSTIARVDRDGSQTVFFHGSTPLGLTGLGVLRKGFVFAAANPGGSSNGSLLVFDHQGRELADIQNAKWLDQPTAIAVHDMGDRAEVFVANAGDGSVVRLDVTIRDGTPRITGGAQIASGYTVGSTSGSAVTGLAYNARTGILYVASPADDAVYAVDGAGTRGASGGTGSVVIRDDATLAGPTGIVVTPSGDLIVSGTAAGGASAVLAQYDPSGGLVSTLDLGTAASLTGMALKANNQGAAIAFGNDTTDALDMIQFGPKASRSGTTEA